MYTPNLRALFASMPPLLQRWKARMRKDIPCFARAGWRGKARIRTTSSAMRKKKEEHKERKNIRGWTKI